MISLKDNVKVMRRNEDGSWSVLHRGVVVGITTSHAQVFNPATDSGDTTPGCAEWFALAGPAVRVEQI